MTDMAIWLFLYFGFVSSIVCYGLGHSNGVDFALKRMREWKKRGLL